MADSQYPNDERLVEACLAGEPGAWSAFMAKYSGLIFISIEKRLKKYGFTLPRQDVEDIRQNTITALWKDKKLDGIRNRGDISYWLAITSGNMAMEFVRKKRSLNPLKPVSIFEKNGEAELAELLPSPDGNPGDNAERNELMKTTGKLIGSLPVKEKLIIKLLFFHGKKYHEIADMLNIPQGTVSNYIKRAKERLRDGLKKI